MPWEKGLGFPVLAFAFAGDVALGKRPYSPWGKVVGASMQYGGIRMSTMLPTVKALLGLASNHFEKEVMTSGLGNGIAKLLVRCSRAWSGRSRREA